MTDTNEQSISQNELDELMQTVELRKQNITAAEKMYEQSLLDLSERAGKTFEHEGQWYQVVVRFSKKVNRKVPFLKLLPGPPSSWLTGMPKGGWGVRGDVPDITTLDSAEVTESASSTEQEASTEASDSVPPLPDVESLDTADTQL